MLMNAGQQRNAQRNPQNVGPAASLCFARGSSASPAQYASDDRQENATGAAISIGILG
jgi:hypothetical protein